MSAIVLVAVIMVIGTIGFNLVDVFAEKEDKVAICHKPNSKAEKTIEVSESAVASHLSHGDKPFACDALVIGEPGIAQQFSGVDPFDLESSTLTFTPLGPSNYSFEVTESVTSFPEVPGDGTTTSVLALSDDSFVEKSIPSTPFFGTDFNSFFIGSNGFVTFGSGDNDFSESLFEFFSQEPRIAMLWDDLNPATGGTITFDEYSDRVVVTFEDVPEFFSTGQNSFQLVLNTNGVIAITYLNVDTSDGIVGISNGFSSFPVIDFN